MAPNTKVDDRYYYGEQRLLTYGLLKGRVVAVVHTWEGDVIRVISARRASKNEENEYFKEIWN